MSINLDDEFDKMHKELNNLKIKNSYLSKNGYVLKKEELTSDELIELKRELVGRPLQDDKYSTFNKKDITFPLYIETKNKIYIPKIYGIKNFGKTKEFSNYIGKDIQPLLFNGQLYPLQIEATNVLINELKNGIGGGILSLKTGHGKTISTLYVLSQLQKKTIIIVNKITLMKQWETEIKTFLPNAKIGFLQGQKNIDINDKDIVIAMLQSLAKIDYPKELFEDFGVTVIDETHNTASKVFSKVLTKLCSKYTIGLSATPKRSDGCEYVFKWFLGDVVYESSAERKGLEPIVNTIKLDTCDYKEICIENKITGKKQIQYSSMINELISMPKRNKLILEKVKYLIKTENRRILILSDRREHLKSLKLLLDNDISIEFSYGLFLGQMKIKDLEKNKKCDVILATYNAFGEGVSEKDLDTLFLITPKKFIGHLKSDKITKNESGKLEQIVGRIFRKEHHDKHPLIVDIHDNFSIYKNQFTQRNAFYKHHFLNVRFKKDHYKLDEIDNINSSLFENQSTQRNAKYKLILNNEYDKNNCGDDDDVQEYNDKNLINMYNECLL